MVQRNHIPFLSTMLAGLLVLSAQAGLVAQAQRLQTRPAAYARPASASSQRQAGPFTPAEQLIFIQANEDRARHGIAPLRWSAQLAQAARLHAARMAGVNAISHQFAGEPDLQTRAMQAGADFSVVAENVAVNPSPAALNDVWMHSPGHRANLLNPQLDSIGVALVQRGGEWFAVQDFSRSVAAMSLEAQEQQVGALVRQFGVTVLRDQPVARQTCAMDDGHAGSRQPLFLMHYTATDLSQLPGALTARLRSGKYKTALVGACAAGNEDGFSTHRIAVMLY
ncbi:MAG: CAP domain-containing protein [Acidobacteriaceae bacterium]